VLESADAREVPMQELVALAQDIPGGAGLTIDFEAISELGRPVVMLRSIGTPHSGALDLLTPREHEVARCIAAGMSNRAIAACLCVSVATVKDHVHRILQRTAAPNRAAIAAAWSAR
jgi:DNA-binding NarL/FixJ family response regulator